MRNSRAIHSAVFSCIGAVGFIASAVLPATSYTVSSHCPLSNTEANVSFPPATLWLSYSSGIWVICVHSPTSRLAILKLAYDGGHRFGCGLEHLYGRPGSNCRRLDL